VDISVTVCNLVCLFLFVCTVTDFSGEDKASNFARWFIGVLGRESTIFGSLHSCECWLLLVVVVVDVRRIRSRSRRLGLASCLGFVSTKYYNQCLK